MTRRLAQIARLVTIPSLLALGVVTAPAVSAGNPCFHDFTMPPTTSGTANEIELLPCAFEPTVTQVAVGAEVTFFNGPEFSHLITGANQGWGSPDVELQPGKSISYTFDEVGIYPYACVLHPGMSGAIVVGDASAALGAGATNDGATDTSSGAGDSTASEPAARGTPTAVGALVAAGTGAGVIVGAAAVWLALRRRRAAEGSLVRAD